MSASYRPVLRPSVSDRDHTRGPEDAPVTLVEYGDFQCPHCARAHRVLPRVLAMLDDRVRFVFRHFPITSSHPNAMHAAEAAESVAASVGEDGFWRMHDLLFEHAQEADDALDDRHLQVYAERAGADPRDVARDLAAATYEEYVKEDFMNGVRSGVNGTPTFFVNGRRYDGEWDDAETFAAALQEEVPS
jgi:protein-disulfide isomerase